MMQEALFLMVAAHFVCDFHLQGDFLARAKDLTKPIPGVPWVWCMIAHSFIHAAAVYLILGSYILAMSELFAHAIIDTAKCAGKINFWKDQVAHLMCKVVWFLIASLAW